MASLRKRRNIWYARIQTLGQKEINISLKTSNKVEARLEGCTKQNFINWLKKY